MVFFPFDLVVKPLAIGLERLRYPGRLAAGSASSFRRNSQGKALRAFPENHTALFLDLRQRETKRA
ncbi:hypothetical protein EFV37_04590 [Mesorhizobium loti]|uniref:Uncharacterized protein n=1 Tax=Mesorhizobium jarvisii TaxID=1777867 RepID=A0A6M7TAA7_9HYPH|nr:hypothetical protein A9K72_08275 [Mesorhizobium loti]QKC61662.1 hypothetical protein EB229_04590 [Mesorhizobium jarvisii]QKD07571.1 hypothetical protein EFV37_04590 [Mesorhizobium loti]RJT35342.1 hypothetical protein D3242_07565 [Mesorhizobium jarvisii]